MIPRVRLRLFVTRLMLLIDDHQTDIRYGQEDRRPRTDHHSPPGALYLPVSCLALRIRETAVIDGQPVTEDPLQPARQLGRQRYLRHQVEDVMPRLEFFPYQVYVYIRLTGGSHAVE